MLPTSSQLRYYWLVLQGDDLDIPCAMFLLECDAKDWIDLQDSKEIYSIQKPKAY